MNPVDEDRSRVNIRAIFAGAGFSMALNREGDVWVWGRRQCRENQTFPRAGFNSMS
ncbi:RCC1-like domain-containing protein [Cystobacter fuscus]